MACRNAKDALVWVQADLIFATTQKNLPKVIKVVGSFSGTSCKVIKVDEEDMDQIMKAIGHGPLECGTSIF